MPAGAVSNIQQGNMFHPKQAKGKQEKLYTLSPAKPLYRFVLNEHHISSTP
jgi:hypothetical protein